MQAVRREHAPAALLAHQREDVDVRAAGALGLLARDLVEPLDLRCDGACVAERRASRRQRPIRLREREDGCARRVRADAIVDEP